MLCKSIKLTYVIENNIYKPLRHQINIFVAKKVHSPRDRLIHRKISRYLVRYEDYSVSTFKILDIKSVYL